jgi:hypothetical protein
MSILRIPAGIPLYPINEIPPGALYQLRDLSEIEPRTQQVIDYGAYTFSGTT